jgi:putative membrane protein
MKTEIFKWFQWIATAFYTMLWIGGVASYILWGAPPENVNWTAPAFLWLAALLVITAIPNRERLILAGCALAGYLIEVAGVHSGIPFGRYSYTDVLYPLLLGTPVVMGAAWVILLAYTRHIMPSFLSGRLSSAALGAVWMVGIDLVIDPLAAGPLGYWIWEHPHGYYGVPWTNFAGWWITSFFLLLIYPIPHHRAGPVLRVGLSTVLFFTILSLLHQLWFAAFAGVLIMSIHLLGRRWFPRFPFLQ